MQDLVAGTLRQGLADLDALDTHVADALRSISPQDLAAGFKTVLDEMLVAVIEDDTGLARRQIQIKMVYLLERFSEKLQDLLHTGEVAKGSDLMSKIERAHHFAARIASVKDKAAGRDLVKDYDQSVQPVSFLDPVSAEDKQSRRAAVRSSFREFTKQGR
jgi:hypothetical protein